MIRYQLLSVALIAFSLPCPTQDIVAQDIVAQDVVAQDVDVQDIVDVPVGSAATLYLSDGQEILVGKNGRIVVKDPENFPRYL